MTQLRFAHATFAASAVFLFSSLSSALAAPNPGCGAGPACAVGFECTVVAESGCASAAPCAPGSSCPAPEPCTTTQEYGCTPAHCTVDSECASGMVCHTWTESCAVSDCACAPNTPDCGCGVAACDPQSVSMCTPRYLLPCKVASDCGDGFSCEEQMLDCANAGTNGSGPAPSGAAPAPAGGAPSDPIEPIPGPDCSPQPSGVFQCVAKQLMCATDAQCPAGWSCESAVVTTSPACAPGSNCANDPAPTPAPWCRPPYYGVNNSGGLEKPTTPTTGTGTGTSTGTGTGSGGSTATGVPPQPETKNADDASSHESAACQMGHAPVSSGALSLLTLLGALFGLKRRRGQP